VADGTGLDRPRAGVGTYTREILLALLACRPEARFTVYSRSEADLGRPGLQPRPLPAGPLVGRHLRWPLELRRLRATAYFGAAGVLPLAPLALPAVVTAHDMAIYRHPEWFPSGQALSVRLVVPRSMRRADAVLAVSRSTARDVADLFDVPGERLRVVPEGVSDRYRPLPEASGAAVRRRLRLPERFVLFVGTIEPRKNLATLLQAWSRLPEPVPLVVAGGWGWRYADERRALERAGGRVRLLGAVDPEDLPGLYGVATCLAHPAWYEGFGLTPLEAMACGTPVVASAATSLPEVVGDAALLVDPGDVEGWTEALARVLGDPDLASELRGRGLRRAAGFTWRRAAEATWEVVDEVVSRREAARG
jgi:glycosyltransferase involved in cell wall biosynthesis